DRRDPRDPDRDGHVAPAPGPKTPGRPAHAGRRRGRSPGAENVRRPGMTRACGLFATRTPTPAPGTGRLIWTTRTHGLCRVPSRWLWTPRRLDRRADPCGGRRRVDRRAGRGVREAVRRAELHGGPRALRADAARVLRSGDGRAVLL